jgi:hypothetical protein
MNQLRLVPNRVNTVKAKARSLLAHTLGRLGNTIIQSLLMQLGWT